MEMWSRDVKRVEMWRDVKKCEEMWRDVKRCEEMWRDVKRCEELKRREETWRDVKRRVNVLRQGCLEGRNCTKPSVFSQYIWFPASMWGTLFARWVRRALGLRLDGAKAVPIVNAAWTTSVGDCCVGRRNSMVICKAVMADRIGIASYWWCLDGRNRTKPFVW